MKGLAWVVVVFIVLWYKILPCLEICFINPSEDAMQPNPEEVGAPNPYTNFEYDLLKESAECFDQRVGPGLSNIDVKLMKT